MTSEKKIVAKHSRVEHAIVNYFLQEQGKFFSFKQLRKKFSKRFQKEELQECVQLLIQSGFLTSRGTQFRHVVAPTEEQPITDIDDIIEGVIDVTAAGHAYVVSPDRDQDIWVSRDNLNTAFDGDQVRVLLTRRKKKKPEGRVLEVVSRARETFIGTIQKLGGETFFVSDQKNTDVDFSIPSTKMSTAVVGDKVVVKLLQWNTGMAH
ncbi:MAG: hypothetical protein H0V65_09500, partial [Chitinophagales bacterium]|nr:hypothetical protein [Chitinophagales bacterium]